MPSGIHAWVQLARAQSVKLPCSLPRRQHDRRRALSKGQHGSVVEAEGHGIANRNDRHHRKQGCPRSLNVDPRLPISRHRPEGEPRIRVHGRSDESVCFEAISPDGSRRAAVGRMGSLDEGELLPSRLGGAAAAPIFRLGPGRGQGSLVMREGQDDRVRAGTVEELQAKGRIGGAGPALPNPRRPRPGPRVRHGQSLSAFGLSFAPRLDRRRHPHLPLAPRAVRPRERLHL